MHNSDQTNSRKRLYISTETDESSQTISDSLVGALKESEETNRSENFAVQSHRNTIALFKAIVYLTRKRLKDGKKSILRYSLQDLEYDDRKAYMALENHIRKIRETEPLFSHVIIYIRHQDIPDNTMIGTYRDADAFPEEFFRYYKNNTLHVEYLQRARQRINTAKSLGYKEHADFLQEIFNRAISFI